MASHEQGKEPSVPNFLTTWEMFSNFWRSTVISWIKKELRWFWHIR